jgi:hypothetical protein
LTLPTNHALAPVPIAHIIDSNYQPPTVPTDRGLAEYSNAYFFSDDTILKDYALPDVNNIHIGGPEDDLDNTGFRRYLYFNNPTPDTDHRLGVSSKLAPFVDPNLPLTNQQWEFDDKVMRDYGEKLFPRAIGYSAGLINYFFRGRMALDPGCDDPLVDDCHPAGGMCAAPSCGSVTTLNIPGLKNISDLGEETGQGTVWAVWPTWSPPRGVDPQTGSFLPPAPGAEVILHLSDPLPIDLTREFSDRLMFTFSNDPPAPVTQTQNPWLCAAGGSVPCDLHLIYRGPLGNESDAIIVLRTPFDID